MNHRRQGNKRRQPLIAIHAVKDKQMETDLKGAPHRFRVYRIELDECAICHKPRKDHLPEDRAS